MLAIILAINGGQTPVASTPNDPLNHTKNYEKPPAIRAVRVISWIVLIVGWLSDFKAEG